MSLTIHYYNLGIPSSVRSLSSSTMLSQLVLNYDILLKVLAVSSLRDGAVLLRTSRFLYAEGSNLALLQ